MLTGQCLENPVLDRFTIYLTSRSRIFHLQCIWTRHHYSGEWQQNLGLCSALRAFEQGGIFIVTQDLSFSGLIRKTAPSSATSYDTQGDVEDLF
jgi:hypothetical protein